MAQCKWCDKHVWRIFLDRNGLCGTCRKDIIPAIESHQAAIQHSRTIVANASLRSVKTRNCLTVIEHAEQLQSYLGRCISVGDFAPSALIDEYRLIHDRLVLEKLGSYRALSAASCKAEGALNDYSQILHVKDALDSLNRIKHLLPQIQTATIISFINQKGGVGKTTTTLNLGAGLARQKKRVLMIDFDPQANLTDGLGIDETKLPASIFDVLKGKIDAKDAVIVLDEWRSVIPSDVSLSRAEKELAKERSNIYLLKNAVEILNGYDFILIDCPPSLGILTLNALAASNRMIVPVQPEYYSLKGLRKVLDALDFVNRKINREIRILGIVGTRYDTRKKLHSEVIEKLKSGLSNGTFISVVRENIAVAEAASFGKSIFDYNPDSTGAEDYLQLTMHVLDSLDKDNQS